jgi:hypothetical protein
MYVDFPLKRHCANWSFPDVGHQGLQQRVVRMYPGCTFRQRQLYELFAILPALPARAEFRTFTCYDITIPLVYPANVLLNDAHERNTSRSQVMSRSGNRKPVGFATHITAGGIAGACEAVSPTTTPRASANSSLWPAAHMPAAGHHQGAHAAFQVWPNTRGESQNLHQVGTS